MESIQFYKVQVDLIRNGDELVESLVLDLNTLKPFGTALGEALEEHNIDAEEIKHYNLNIRYLM